MTTAYEATISCPAGGWGWGGHVCQAGHHTKVLQDTAPRADVMVTTAAALPQP